MMTRTSADRTAELLAVFAARSQQRMREEFTERVVAIHDADPLWVLDDAANRVLRALRSQSIVGKHLIYGMGPDGPWRIGLVDHDVSGHLLLLDEAFDDYETAMRGIFSARRTRFLESLSTDSNGSSET